jgi:3-oxoacyl-[acyl-carrier protein] reductase
MPAAPDLTGRNAFVTGGSRGIGRAIALALASAGAGVAVNYTRHPDEANSVVAEIEQLGRKAAAFQGDVSDYASCEAMVTDALGEFGNFSILVNNAGIASRGNSVVDTDPEEMRRVVSTHAFGSFYVSQLLIPQMREQPRGDIVMISSGAATSLGARGGPYNMAKSAMEALALTIAKEERASGIRCNIVAPGLVETDMGARLMKARGSDIKAMGESSPFGRVCQPEDIANAVLFLCSEAGSYITNQRITVNGGGF